MIRDLIRNRENYKRSLQWILTCIRSCRLYLLFISLFAAIRSFWGIGLSIAVRDIIDSASSGTIRQKLGLYAVVLLALDLIIAFYSYFGSTYNEKIDIRLTEKVYEKVLHTKWLPLSSYQTGDLHSRICGDSTAIANFVTASIPSLVASCIQLICAAVIVFLFSPKLVFAIFCLSILAAFFMCLIRRKIFELQKNVREKDAVSASFITESIFGLKTVKSFRREDAFSEKLNALFEDYLSSYNRRQRFGKFCGFIADISFDISYFIVFAWAVLKLGKGEITYGTLSMLISLQGYIQSPIRNIVSIFSDLIRASVAGDRINMVDDAAVEEDTEIPQMACPSGIRIDDISFRYQEDLPDVLKDFSCEIAPGEFVAVTGPSGVGKTTLIMTLLDLIRPQSGEITFFDRAGNVCHPCKSAREFIAYVPQGNTLFTGTIRENICFGQKDLSDEEIDRVLYLADARDFVSELKSGLETGLLEKGSGLSEGQAQRIAVARALARKPAILILDEATSALDGDAERNILTRIRAMENRPTIICITHRDTAIGFTERQISLKK